MVKVFAQIATLETNYQDPDNLLSSAEKEVVELKRLNELKALYSRAVREMDSGHWYEARELLKQIKTNESGFLETERLLLKVETEVKNIEDRERREKQINTLYEQARGLVQSRMWQDALNKLTEIHKLDEQFDDYEQIAKLSKYELEREIQVIEFQNKLTGLYAEAVSLLREQKYQNALEKWQEIIALDPKYPDRQKVEVASKKELARLTKPNRVNLRQTGFIVFFTIALVVIILVLSQTVKFNLNKPTITTTANVLAPTKLPTLFLGSPTPFIAELWEFANDNEGWYRSSDPNKLRTTNGILTFSVTANQSGIVSPGLQISAYETPIITIRMRIQDYNFNGATYGAIYFVTDKDSIFDQRKRMPFILYTSDRFVTYDIDMKRQLTWKDTITNIQLVPIDSPVLTSYAQISIEDISIHAFK